MMISLFFITAYSFAQSGKVLVQNAADNSSSKTTLKIKWYAPGVLFPEGVNIYRREAGSTSWDKLNEGPIFRKYTVTDQVIAADSSLSLFTEIVNEGGWDTFSEGGFLELNAIVKSFASAIYADFLGIYYEDYTAIPGQTYTYRIQKYQNGRETLVGQSQPIEAGLFSPKGFISGFAIEQEEKNIKLDWEINEDLFFGINIYRSKNDSAYIKLNKNPLVISQVERDGTLTYPSPKYIDPELEENDDYKYYARGVDFFNQEILPTDTISINLADVTPPLPPKYLERELDTMEVRLKWVHPEGDDIKEIKLFRGPSSDGPFESIFDVQTETEYIDILEKPGPYFYYVSSFDYGGNEASSRMVFADIKDLEPPAKPTGITVQADTGKYIIKWDPNSELDLLHYRVFRKANSQANTGTFLLLPEFPEVNKYEYRLPKNTLNPMSFYVVAVDTAENISEPSEIVTDQMPDIVPPQTPQFRTIGESDDQFVISWYQNVEPDLMGYNLLRADSLQPLKFEVVNRNLLSPSVYQYTDRDIEMNKGYLYKLVVSDSAGNNSESEAKYGIYETERSIEVGGAINVRLKYKKRRKTSTLSWTPVEMKGLLGYVVFKGESANSLRPETSLTNDLQFKDSKPAETTFYQVKAYNKNGDIVESEILEWEK